MKGKVDDPVTPERSHAHPIDNSTASVEVVILRFSFKSQQI